MRVFFALFFDWIGVWITGILDATTDFSNETTTVFGSKAIDPRLE